MGERGWQCAANLGRLPGGAADVAEGGRGGVDCVVTDPPYGVNRSQNGMRKQCGHKTSTTYLISEWEDTEQYISKVCVPAINESRQVADAVALTPGFKMLNAYPRADHIGGFYYQGQSTVTSWGAAWWQPILFYGRDPHIGRLQRDIFIANSVHPSKQNGHPCPKELKSWSQLVERMSKQSQTVLDPFMGSGTTGVAAVRLGRKFIGIEIEPKYFEIAKKRIQEELDRYPLFEEKSKETQNALFVN